MDSIDACAPICNWCGEPADDTIQGKLVRSDVDHELYHTGCLGRAEELAAAIEGLA